MKISVAICTWNRARLLDQTLESISKLDIPEKLDWELVVVDNNSTERAVPIILNAWREQLPMVTTIEKKQGHSAARNCAIELAKGDYIVWTDNDVNVSKQWLAAYADAFRKNPEAVYFGGPIEPVFENGKPDWIEKAWDMCAPVYATRDLGKEPFELGHHNLPYGANFAIRTDIQKKFPYDTKWGRNATGMLGEDEVSVLRAIDESGEKGFWIPDAALEHVIPEDRATEKYVSDYYFGQGFANALKDNVTDGRSTIRWKAFQCRFRYRWHKLFSNTRNWVFNMIHASIFKGELAGLKSLKGEAKKKE